jgi:hypothetical protein
VARSATGVVDEQVERPELLDCHRNGSLDLIELSHIHLQR